jgi:hypothetical protein
MSCPCGGGALTPLPREIPQGEGTPPTSKGLIGSGTPIPPRNSSLRDVRQLAGACASGMLGRAMQLQQTFAGLEARLKPSGAARFFTVAFLTVWLSFWAVGESFAAWILFKGARSLLAGRAFDNPGGALAVGGFLIVWLSLWTLGGVLAGSEWLRQLFGYDRLLVRLDGVELEQGYGLFRRRKFFSRENIRRFYLARAGRSGRALMIETRDGAKQLTRFGTDDDRAALESTLTHTFKLATPAASAGAIPHGWCELTTPEGTAVLTSDPVARRKQARFVWILFLTFAAVAAYLGGVLIKQPGFVPLLVFVSIIAALLGWGAITLTRSRSEWRLEHGRTVLQRRTGQKVTPKFEAVSLQLVENSDSDGDTVFNLVGLAPGAAPEASPGSLLAKDRRIIFSRPADPTDARNLGLWFARRCHLPFADRTSVEAKTQDLESLKQQLANSGRFGKVAAALLDRAKPR